MQAINQAKALLGITDNLQDDLLEVIQDLTEAHLQAYLNKEVVPEKLSYIIVEVMIKRFNRLGSEGMKSQKVEGLDMEFALDDFAEYDKVIKQQLSDDFKAGFKML